MLKPLEKISVPLARILKDSPSQESRRSQSKLSDSIVPILLKVLLVLWPTPKAPRKEPHWLLVTSEPLDQPSVPLLNVPGLPPPSWVPETLGASLTPLSVIVTSWLALLLDRSLSSLRLMRYVAVTDSPAARYWLRLLSRLKVQLTVPALVLERLPTPAPERVKVLARSCSDVFRALETLAPLEALAPIKALLTIRRSLRSTSLKLMLPLSRRRKGLPLALSSVTSPVALTTLIRGLSLDPVTEIVNDS